MTTLARITIAFLLALILSSCGFDINFGDFGTGIKGNGIVVEENREITDDFTEISASEGLEVTVTQANDFEITVEGDENIIDLIGTDIKNGKLRIHAIENIGRATKKVRVSLPQITALSSSSGANLRTENEIKADYLEIDASSGALVQLNVSAEDIDIDASSGANLDLSGSAQKAFIDGSSGANVNAKKLFTTECNAEASSGANIGIHVSKSLTADASSGGNISYSGDATIQKNKSVSGSVNKY
ncbi:MAG: DUF2807 domain-containing protein [Maribacter sp.]|nr:DUF2807 domain-containing protein [Maribacter sp.]